MSTEPDEDGYPTDLQLAYIAQCKSAPSELLAFVRSLWWCADWGWRQTGNYYAISTAGWSGNEALISAMAQNHAFWSRSWKSSRRGGHYEFEAPE